jgi:hypothetical protein
MIGRDFSANELLPSANSSGLFYRKRIIIASACAVIGLAIALIANVFGEDQKSSAPDATIASESALGHKAFISMLDRLNVGNEVNFGPFAALMGGKTLTIFLEPNPAEIAPVDLAQRIKGEAVFMVLPKWTAVADPARPRWIKVAQPMELRAVQEVARAAISDVRIVRSENSAVWKSQNFRQQPDLDQPQMMQSAKMKPLIYSADGILFGSIKRGKTTVYVLSDPDILNNHGLDNGFNAVLAVRLIEFARGKSLLSFDSSVQKFEGSISLWRQLFLPPLLGLVLLTLGAICVLVWHVLIRLSPPHVVEPGPGAGKMGLIKNSAALFDTQQHDAFLKQRYLESVVAEVAIVMPIVARSDGAHRGQLLDDMGARRGTTERYSDILALTQAAKPSVAVAARRMDIWKQEIIRGLG